MIKIDKSGTISHMLTVICESHTKKKNGKIIRYWLCDCACGNRTIISASKIGITKSCGCLLLAGIRPSKSKINSPEIKSVKYSWKSMKGRCKYHKNASFEHYGGRKIKVCDRWLNSFDNFLEDMGLKPTPKHSLDRIDVNGNYELSNCRWATISEQSFNKRNNHKVSYKGETLSIMQWAKRFELKFNFIQYRIKEKGMTMEEIMSLKIKDSWRCTYQEL